MIVYLFGVLLLALLIVLLYDFREDKGAWLNQFERDNRKNKREQEAARKALDTQLNQEKE